MVFRTNRSVFFCATLGLASIALAAPTSASATPDAVARSGHVLYVSKHGSDRHSGSSSHPLRTIQVAINRSQQGGTVVVRPGHYHESLMVAGNDGLTIRASRAGRVELDGTSSVHRWQRAGAVWVRKNWHHEYNSSPTFTWNAPDNPNPNWSFVNPAHPMAAHPDQVFVDGHALRQVNALSKVHGHRFYVDYGTHQLFIGVDPTGRAVRASTLAKAMTIRSAGVEVDGLVVSGFAPSVPNMGAITLERPHDKLSHMVVQNNSTTGVFAGSTDQRLNRVVFRHNGLLGFMATYADGLVVNRATVRHNNTELFNMSPAAGGAKIGRTDGVVVRHSRFTGNHGTGLWFDESSFRIKVLASRMLRNAGHGISVEISGRAAVVGNLIADNRGNGIKVNDTNRVQLWNNTFVGNARPVNIVQDRRDLNPGGSYHDPSLPLPWIVRDISVQNNVIARGSRSDCLLCLQDYTGRFSAAGLNDTALGNVYQRRDTQSPAALVLWSQGSGQPPTRFSTIKAFRSATGQEQSHLSLTGRSAVGPTYRARAVVRHAAATVAVPLPTWVARISRHREGTRWLGAWLG